LRPSEKKVRAENFLPLRMKIPWLRHGSGISGLGEAVHFIISLSLLYTSIQHGSAHSNYCQPEP
jgi:hypothetical protein